MDNLAPNFMLKSSGVKLEEDVTDLVLGVEYEDNDELADLIQVTIDNSLLTLTDSKVFAEGNYLDLWMGYGNDLEYMGRGIIHRWMPVFPENDKPSFTVKAYGIESLFNIEIPEEKSQLRIFLNQRHSQIIEKLCQCLFTDENVKKVFPMASFSVKFDIEDTGAPVDDAIIQGETVWQYILKTARLIGYAFYIEYSIEDDAFIVHFHKTKAKQKEVFTFEYFNGDDSTLLSFEPEFSTQDIATTVEVVSWDRRENRPIITTMKKTEKGVDVRIDRAGKNTTIEKAITSGSKVRVTAFGTSRLIDPKTAFDNEFHVRKYAEKLFREIEENFITGKGKTVGVETLRAKQVHILKGIGERLSGKYYFNSVRHIMKPDNIYYCEFNCRKVLEVF